MSLNETNGLCWCTCFPSSSVVIFELALQFISSVTAAFMETGPTETTQWNKNLIWMSFQRGNKQHYSQSFMMAWNQLQRISAWSLAESKQQLAESQLPENMHLWPAIKLSTLLTWLVHAENEPPSATSVLFHWQQCLATATGANNRLVLTCAHIFF